MPTEPLSLQEHCFLHIISHLESYPCHELALLPKHWRHALLRTIAPIHVYQLEKTAVADTIDTEHIWEEMSHLTDSVWASYSLLDSYCDSLRDRYISYICHLLFNEQNRAYVVNRITQLLFAVHTSRLDNDTTKSLTHHIQSLFIALPPYYLVPFRCPVSTEMETVSLLVETGALPKVLEIYVSHFCHTKLWEERNTRILGQLLSAVRSLKVYCTNNSSVMKELLKEVTESTKDCLRWLELCEATVATVWCISPYLTAPSGYQGLTKLHLSMRKHGFEIGPEIADIIFHQLNSLESLSLKHFWTDSISNIEEFCSAVVVLIGQPQFQRLKLEHFISFPLEAVQLIIHAQLSSSPFKTQYIHFEHMRIINSKGAKLVSADVDSSTCKETGFHKHLYLTSVTFPPDLLEWITSINCICLNTLDLYDFTLDPKPPAPAECICECVIAHPNLHVDNVRFVPNVCVY